MNPRYRLAFELDSPILYVDVGAREGLDPPFSLLPEKSIQVIGFEPDPSEAEDLRKKHPQRTYYPYAVWSERCTRKIYLNKDAQTSSLFPPNEEFNRDFEEYHWKNRVVAREVEVQCESLDHILQIQPDFIKLDTQGAEYEIIQGARRILTEGAPLVVAETWLRPVYKGQKLVQDVISLMESLDYSVFEAEIAAAWRHRTSSPASRSCKQKLVGWDLLFVKNSSRILELKLEAERFKRLCALLELYGFRDYAIFLVERSHFSQGFKQDLLARFHRNHEWDSSLKRKLTNNQITRTIRHKLGLKADGLYPRLHY